MLTFGLFFIIFLSLYDVSKIRLDYKVVSGCEHRSPAHLCVETFCLRGVADQRESCS